MRLRALLFGLVALLQTIPALALVNPPASTGADPRMRTVVYNRNDPVELTAAPGTTLRIEFGIDESVTGVVVSDQGTIAPEMVPAQTGYGAMVGGLASSASKGPSSCDPNLCRSVINNFVYLKPLRSLDPQPVFIQTSRVNAFGKTETVPYTFELLTRTGQQSAAAGTTWSVTFVYPERIRAARLVAWRKRKAQQDEAARVRLAISPPGPAYPSQEANWRYGYRGSASVQPDQAWDDGRTTFLRFNGNRRVPNIYSRSPDGHESIPAYATEPDAMGTTLRVSSTKTKWFIRDGDEAGCMFDLGPDPQGATAMTVVEPKAGS